MLGAWVRMQSGECADLASFLRGPVQTSAQDDIYMRRDRILAALAVLSLPVQGALAALTPTPNSAPKSAVLPAKPMLADPLSEVRVAPPSADTAPVLSEPRPDTSFAPPPSLADLVARHADIPVRDRDMECLAVAVYYEAKSEPLEGQLAVAQTVLNRVQSGRFPATACGVVLQPRQFSFVRRGVFPTPPRTSRQWQTAVAIAHIASERLWSGTVDDALFFHARYVNPGWRLERIAVLGNHVFYR